MSAEELRIKALECAVRVDKGSQNFANEDIAIVRRANRFYTWLVTGDVEKVKEIW